MVVEDVARHIFALAGIPEIGEQGVVHVAEAFLGDECCDFHPQDELVTLSTQPPRILIRFDLSSEEITLAVAVGLARWWLTEHPELAGQVSEDELAVCLAVPPQALLDAAERLSRDVGAIADEFRVSTEVVAHRMRSLPPETAHPSGFREKLQVAG
jgi:IrrE N-terminal-like domain